jgi:hypothetical protein
MGSDEELGSRAKLLVMMDDLIVLLNTNNDYKFPAKVLKLARDRIDIDGRVFVQLAKLTDEFGK